MSDVTVRGYAAAEPSENIKDTIESLVVAFILAFVFRGFLVEAFVIPTGSMAPTLYGKHGTQICPDCGWEFAYGLPDRYPEREWIKCPNCDWESASHEDLPYHAPGRGCKEYSRWFDPTLARVDPELAERVSQLYFMPRSGDRILVFKWPFDIGGELLGPRPWDVVVFKNPQNGEDNYIKRLVGMPGEVLEIIDGDIYTCPVEALDSQTVRLMDEVIELKHQALQVSGSRKWFESRIADHQRVITAALDDLLKIRRKTDVAQKSLWHTVFDQASRPQTRRVAPPRWAAVRAQSSWDSAGPRVTFQGLDAEPEILEFRGKDIVDYYAYNRGGRSGEGHTPVGDLRLRFVLTPDTPIGDGVLALSLSKRDDVFKLEWSPSGTMVLKWSSLTTGSEQIIKAVQTDAWVAGKPLEVEFGNVDYQVYVKLHGQEPPVLTTTDEEYASNLSDLRGMPTRQPSQVRIIADHLNISLDHLVLGRDVYYKNSVRKEGPGWGTSGNPILLRQGEYYVLGDNSPASQDSRLWNRPGDYLMDRGAGYQLGTVPADQLIGRAFFVYWPSGYRVRWLPILKNFGVIPNVGKMRWIR